jgi:hypothetical protein
MDTNEKPLALIHSAGRMFSIYFRCSKSVSIRVYPRFKLLFAYGSTSDQFLQVFRIARALQRDLVGGGGNFTEIVRR